MLDLTKFEKMMALTRAYTGQVFIRLLSAK